MTKLPSKLVKSIDEAVQKILPDYDKIIVDSTGFECTCPSHYYCVRRNSPYPVDGFITLFAAIDQENGYFRTHKTRAKKKSTTQKCLFPF